ncbi:MAG: winged helix-turn-helix domain-containing protein [Rubrivivax sp.]
MEFDEARAELLIDGRLVPAEPQPLRVLGELLRHRNEVVTKEELFATVWDRWPTGEHVLPSAVNRLRKALGPKGSARIVTLPRLGYRFAGSVRCEPLGRIRTVRHPWQSGMALPGREEWRLQGPLAAPHSFGHCSTWLAVHEPSRQRRLLRCATDAAGLLAIKHEAAVSRVLQADAVAHRSFAAVLHVNFSEPPFSIEIAHPGTELLHWGAESGTLATMTEADRLVMFAELAEGVAAAHIAGIVHGSICPSNLLLAESAGVGRLVLMNAGCESTIDPPWRRLAPPSHLAPEQLVGEGPGVASDVYAMGTLLYQLCVGDLTRQMACGWHRDVECALLREDIAAATAAQPAHRLPNLQALVLRLQALAARREATDGHSVHQPQKLEPQMRHRHWTGRMRMGGALGCTLAVCLLLAWWAWRQSSP